jgi:hypothetical protein
MQWVGGARDDVREAMHFEQREETVGNMVETINKD